ncbi:diversity-generating retroelement protein Avd [Enterocloster bolteae]|uniref:diversity-generating retroelement protein Avd n=1 Tax=Enterocloster bolteae TaxID=208479 RepID=UPI002A8179BD|nr:diversity-generating retroelement protein Avd [Enterocloster bolteae]
METQIEQSEQEKHNGNDVFKIKEKIYEMILYGNPQLLKFPKTERYVLAGDIRKSMYAALEMAVRLEKKYHKKTTLQDLDIEIDVLRNLLRLAKDPNLYPKQKPCLDFHTWEVWIRKVNEIGCMIGGYMQWVNSREKQK